MGQLHPELMCAAGLRANLQQRETAMDRSTLVVQQRLPAAGRARLEHLHAAGVPVFLQPILQRAGFPADLPFDHRPVDFLHRPLAKLLCQARRRLAGPCEEQHARDRFVQAMDDSQKDLSRLLVFFFQVSLGGAIKCFFTALKVRAQRTSRLGDGQAVVVFKEHIKRRRHSSLACNKRLSEKGTGLLFGQ